MLHLFHQVFSGDEFLFETGQFLLVKTEFLVFLVDLQLFLLELDLLVFHFLQNLDELVLLSSVPHQEISFYFPDLLLVLFNFLSNERQFMMNFLRELLNLVEKHFQFRV
jgi:hypothetical protein